MRHPYVGAPAHQFWRSAMAQCPPGEIDPVVASPWRISATDRVATAGSCFAQHVARRLREAGLQLLVTEPAHSILPEAVAEAFGYGLYSARFGSIYSTRQLLQLLRRAYGRFTPQEDFWEGPDRRMFDPFRPTVQPDGFATRREYEADRRRHFAAVREMFERADVFVFTMGLTEAWRSKADGAVYPLCPGVAAGQFDPDRYEFHNFSVTETVADLEAFLSELEKVNPKVRVILTVSPVPLAATAEPRHVWTSTTESKAILRAAAGEASRRSNVVYFPSYEIITSPASRGAYFEEDLRTISPAGVDHVMRVFFRHLVEGAEEGGAEERLPLARDSFLDQARKAVDVICDEARLDASSEANI
jgi:hypothetical protein